MEDHQQEYRSQAEATRDGWRGTYLGMAVVVILLLAFNELRFSRCFVDGNFLPVAGLKFGVALTFAFWLFFIKNAKGYNQLEKLRFVALSLLVGSVMGIWLAGLSNRILPGSLEQQEAWGYVHHVQGESRIRFGKKQGTDFDRYALRVEILTQEAIDSAKPTVDPKPADLSLLSLPSPLPASVTEQRRVPLTIIKGRWGQSFIAQP